MGKLSRNYPTSEAVEAALNRANKAEADLSELQDIVDTKADETVTDELQSQINQIVIASAEEYVVAPEVAQARVGNDGTEYNTLKDHLNAIEDRTDTQEVDINYTKGALNSCINTVEDVTVEAISEQTIKTDYILVKGRHYAYTNLTSGAVNLKVYDKNDVSTTILSSLLSGKTYFFTCDNEYVAFSCWAQQSGEVVLAAVDDGFFVENQHTRDYGALVDIDTLFKQNNEAFTITRERNGAKFTTKRDIPSGNFGVTIPIPIESLSIRSIEFDIESNGGAPQIFVSQNGTVTHISRLVYGENVTFEKKHIIFNIPDTNIEDGDETTLSFWNSIGALKDGWFTVTNLEFKRNISHSEVNKLVPDMASVKDFTSFVDFYSVLTQNANIFDMERVGSGIKFTTNRDIVSGNFGVSLALPLETYSIKSIEFDIESVGGSPQIFVSKNSTVTHINRIMYEENATFEKKHIAFDIPNTNLEDGDDTTFSIWNANHALKDGYFIISNFVVKRNTIYNKITNINASDIPINNKLIYDMQNAERWNYGSIVKNANNIEYTPVDGQNGGVQSPAITSSSRGFIDFEFEIAETYHTNLYVYLFGKSTSSSNLYIQLDNNIRNAGIYKVSIDLNHYVVYQNLDLSQPIRVAVTTEQTNNAEVLVLNKFNVYDSTSDLGIDGSVSDGINYVNSAVNTLANQIESMSSNVKVADEYGNTYLLQVSNGSLVIIPTLASNILYIGNSLLLGFTTFGMAASNSSSDYYHYVNEYLTSKGVNLTTDRLMGANWESCTSYSAQNTWMQNNLLPKLNDNIELVIVQLGDNVNTAEKQAVFAQGSINLLRYIRQHAPRARLAWVGAWYTTSTKQSQMAAACKEVGATFVDISLLPDIEGNRNHIGGEWTDDNGNVHVIESSGVASHPSSQGMRAVADKIINELF